MKKEYTKEEYFMQRCLDLAKKGLGKTYPNPMVGSVIVHNNKIIGEGWHQKAGTPHAEVHAIASVKDKTLLKEATLYVSLEPCNHFGKTPPCAQLIVKHHIPKVVIGCIDPFEKVNGSGVNTLKKAGIHVTTGVLATEAEELNKRFFTFHQKKRPYLILKWAQSKDGFIAPLAKIRKDQAPVFLSSKEEQILVHQWRTEEAAILVGAQTAITDNPRLSARWVKGNQPTRIVLDPKKRLPQTLHVFDKTIETHHITQNLLGMNDTVTAAEFLDATLQYLYQAECQSVIIEGGRITLQHFIDNNLWDEARIFSAPLELKKGIDAPILNKKTKKQFPVGLTTLLPPQTQP